MLSIDLQICIEAIKISLLNNSPAQLVELLTKNQVNWNSLQKKVAFHGLRPVVYDAFKKIDSHLILPAYFDELKQYTFQQSLFNLVAVREMVSLLNLLDSHGIRAAPLKGILFVHEFYGRKPLREGSDLDIFVPREDAAKALTLLVEECGYFFTVPESFMTDHTNQEIIKIILSTKGYHEVGLEKKNTRVHIDFHWESYEDFYQYRLPENFLVSHLSKRTFFNDQCLLPSQEDMFWTLLIHHGGREKWVRLKYFCDLIMFYSFYAQTVNWTDIFDKAGEYKLKQALIEGFYCLEKQFSVELPDSIKKEFLFHKKKSYTNILSYWELAENGNESFTAKKKLYELYFALQDKGFSYIRHVKYSFLKRASPNPLEKDKRIIVFPEQYYILNFLAHLVGTLSIYVGIRKRKRIL